jgi:hypothetical protein
MKSISVTNTATTCGNRNLVLRNVFIGPSKIAKSPAIITGIMMFWPKYRITKMAIRLVSVNASFA